jgi:ABC-type branched-subunit amino acid transport system ATPase component
MTSGPDLVIDRITVRFGGLVAVDEVSLRAPGGEITGLIGPNGAGKTTIFNASAGSVSLASGTITLGSLRLDGHPVPWRANHGLGRTFQRMELFDSMTVAQNVAFGPEAQWASHKPWGQLMARRSEKRDVAERAENAMALCGITALRDQVAGSMSTGQRRLVELARALATPFKFLLLDEPSSGLDVSETERFGSILREFVAISGTGILLVEHDMALIAAVCNLTHVLEYGHLIFSGTAAETLESDEVRAAYLGAEVTEVVHA